MRVVLDTNIFVSGIHWSGVSEEILKAWFLGKFELISSLAVIEELVRILISFKIPMKIEDIFWWESLLLEKSTLVIPKKKVSLVKDDPDDNKFIETALEGKAEYIVSQDKHLLRIMHYEDITIIHPKGFLKLIHK